MRKLLIMLLAVAVLATACGLDESSTAQRSVAVRPLSEPVGGAAVDNEQAEGPPVDGPQAVPAVTNTAVCGFDEDLEPDRIEVPQIPGGGREDTVSALDFPDDVSFGEPLVDLNRILSGGPPPDGIPPIDAPVFQTANTVDWIQCNEPVLALSVNGETRAYPVQIMTWHELVNDTFGEVPVAVSYCPLCNSALAYRRDLGDRIVTFGTSGRLFNSSLAMYDRETESLWTHFNGMAVVGTLVGTELELLPMQTLSWRSFLQANPDALVLTRETGHDRSYGQNPYSGYDDVTTNPSLFDGENDPRLPAKERIVGIRRGDDSAAIVLEGLASAGVFATEVDGDVLSVWHLPGTATALEERAIADGRDVGAVGVYLPMADGQVLTFVRANEPAGDGGNFTDEETGSTWNIQGLAISGPLEGHQLERVEHLDTFWFALAAFEPDTRVVDP
jgi:hypothetical protein